MSFRKYKRSESYIERACGTASSFGTVVGRAVSWITVSCRSVVSRSRDFDNLEREGKILSKIYKVKKRLHKIEKELRDSGTLSKGEPIEELKEIDPGSYRTNERERTRSIVQGLNHPDPKVRSAAATSAAKTGTFSETYFLILLLDDPVPFIRKQAWIAIRKITGIDFEFDPEEEETLRRAKIERLKNWWKEQGVSNLKEGFVGNLDRSRHR